VLAHTSCNAPKQPRVVILERQTEVVIEVVELPDSAGIGTEFCYRGGWWRITAHRPHTRVLLAEQVSLCPATNH
jgi:hypothetical protein